MVQKGKGNLSSPMKVPVWGRLKRFGKGWCGKKGRREAGPESDALASLNLNCQKWSSRIHCAWHSSPILYPRVSRCGGRCEMLRRQRTKNKRREPRRLVSRGRVILLSYVQVSHGYPRALFEILLRRAPHSIFVVAFISGVQTLYKKQL